MCQAVLIDRGLDLLLFVPHLALPLFGFLGASKVQILSDRFSVAFLFYCRESAAVMHDSAVLIPERHCFSCCTVCCNSVSLMDNTDFSKRDRYTEVCGNPVTRFTARLFKKTH